MIAFSSKLSSFLSGVFFVVLGWGIRGDCVGVGLLQQQVRVFSLQPELWTPPRDDVLVRYNLSLKFSQEEETEFSDVSLCYRVKPTSLASYEAHLSLADSNYANDVLFLYRQGETPGLYYNGVRQRGFQDLRTDLRLHSWTHYCHVFSSGEYLAYIQGEERARGPITAMHVPLSLNSTLTLGQEQDLVAGGFDVEQIFRGYMAQVNIWNRTLTPADVIEQASCETAEFGNISSLSSDISRSQS